MVQPFAATVAAADRLSPSFVRLRLVLEDATSFAATGDDQRVRLLLPSAAAPEALTDLVAQGEHWHARWRQLPDGGRPASRAYTVRAQRLAQDGTLDVDVVLHGLDDGTAGPAARFAVDARPGDVLAVVGSQGPVPDGVLGTEAGRRAWGVDVSPPADATGLLLVAEETAVPAVSSVLEGLEPTGPPVVALMEVPASGDVLPLGPVPGRAQVRWLPRDGAPLGGPLRAAVVDAAAEVGAAGARPYGWAAGESGLVREVRRLATGSGGLPRAAVTTVGYWREGRAGA